MGEGRRREQLQKKQKEGRCGKERAAKKGKISQGRGLLKKGESLGKRGGRT